MAGRFFSSEPPGKPQCTGYSISQCPKPVGCGFKEKEAPASKWRTQWVHSLVTRQLSFPKCCRKSCSPIFQSLPGHPGGDHRERKALDAKIPHLREGTGWCWGWAWALALGLQWLAPCYPRRKEKAWLWLWLKIHWWEDMDLWKPFFKKTFWLPQRHVGIFIPWRGTEPIPPALKVWSLNHWTTRGGPGRKPSLQLL